MVLGINGSYSREANPKKGSCEGERQTNLTYMYMNIDKALGAYPSGMTV
jgi:hypothetical protein